MTSWSDLDRELDNWAAAGRMAEFWWRDDDAVSATPALDRLLALQRQSDAGLALAVIPARADESLVRRLAGEGEVVVFQHGWAHANHAPPGQPKAELGSHRLPSYVMGELNRGALVLDRLFGPTWHRVLVPPHNRIAVAVAHGLSAAGYVGLSVDKPRISSTIPLSRINVHIDIMEWSRTRAFLGDSLCLDQVIAHLRAKRVGEADAAEPTGFLTHHLAHDESAWQFAAAFLARTTAHAAVRWRDPRRLFAAEGPGP